jgi:hypothetical protein
MRKNILITLILTLAEISYCQDYIDVLSLPRPDCSGKIWNSFYDNENKIMVLSDVYQDDDEYKRMYRYFLLDYLSIPFSPREFRSITTGGMIIQK